MYPSVVALLVLLLSTFLIIILTENIVRYRNNVLGINLNSIIIIFLDDSKVKNMGKVIFFLKIVNI